MANLAEPLLEGGGVAAHLDPSGLVGAHGGCEMFSDRRNRRELRPSVRLGGGRIGSQGFTTSTRAITYMTWFSPPAPRGRAPMLQETANSVYTPEGANAGDHVNMAYWVGGSMQKGAAAAMVHPIMGGGACGTYAFMRVNKDGKRFCNEDAPLLGITNAYMTSPGHVVWTVMDADFASELSQMTLLSQYSGSTSGPFDPTLGYTPEEQMEMCLETGASVTGETLEDLAAAMGVPADNLAAAVARYNELAARGADEDFGKDAANLFPIARPPFYASQVTAALLTCASGLNVDSSMNVCSAAGEAIPGLYAVGNAAGNFFSNDYPMVCPGISHGRCLTLGYVLGEQLAR